MKKPEWSKEKTEDGWVYKFGPDYSALRVRRKGRYGWEMHCVAYYRELPLHDGTLHFPGKSSLPKAKSLCEKHWERRMFRKSAGMDSNTGKQP